MSAYIPHTPVMARFYCPDCEPNADPIGEILDVRWCESHSPLREGLDDAMVGAEVSVAGGSEAGGGDNRRWGEVVVGARASVGGGSEGGGEANRRWCEIFHRRR